MSNAILDALIAEVDARRPVALVTVVGTSASLQAALGSRLVVREGDEVPAAGALPDGVLQLAHGIMASVQELLRQDVDGASLLRVEDGGAWLELFAEVQRPPRHLVLCGAGHIAQPLAEMAHICGFDVTIIDDRAYYASRTRFPIATRIEVGPFRQMLRQLRHVTPFDRRTYLVLVTRGHQHDVDCLLEVLDDDLAYVGMIGSQRRIRAVFALLESEQHIPAERFAAVHAPIGLDIAAQTPAEIAVAILAEMIDVTRGGRGRLLSETIREEREARRARARQDEGSPA